HTELVRICDRIQGIQVQHMKENNAATKAFRQHERFLGGFSGAIREICRDQEGFGFSAQRLFHNHYGYHGLANDSLTCAAEKVSVLLGSTPNHDQVGLPGTSSDDEFNEW